MSDEHPSGVSGAIGLPFAEQIAFFRNKLGNLVPTQAWDDMQGADHDTGFMVAGAMKAELLADLVAAVDKYISEGKGLEEFHRDWNAIVAKHGWTGWTGQGSVKGEAWRVKVVARTNAYTSYAAGRYAQLKADGFPLWVYRHGGSVEPRPQHLDWDGLILPSDHEFWDIFYPPSDWGCRCYVVGAQSVRIAELMGGQPSKKLDANWKEIDPKTGTIKGAGRGWDYAPGASVAGTVQAMAAKVGNWDYGIARMFMGGLPVASQDAISAAYRSLPSTADDTRRLAAAIAAGRHEPSRSTIRSLGMVSAEQQQRVEQLLGRRLERSDFRVSSDFIRHVQAEHSDPAIETSRGQRPVTPADFAQLPQLLDRPDEIAISGTSGQGETTVQYRKRIGREIYTAFVAINRHHRTFVLKTFYVGI